MAADNEQGERSEEATQQRREDFRKRGQIAQTKELSSVFVLFASLAMVWGLSRFLFTKINALLHVSFGEGFLSLARGNTALFAMARFATETAFWMIAPVLGVMAILSFASTALQIGFIYNEEALQFKLDRLDPVQGIMRLLNLKSLVEGGKALLKVVLILFISYTLLKEQLHVLPQVIHFSVGQIFDYLGTLLVRLFAGVGIFMLVIAMADYFFQRWELEKEMKMTKQEIREEHKSREGDPQIKSRIKRMQREVASRRMMEEVPKADVIITNPTHIAVAIKYDDTMVAPRVIAKGADLIAEKIKALAKEKGIPVVENKPLARAMFKTIKIGQTIPKELYTAVAEVLSYIYKMKKRRA